MKCLKFSDFFIFPHTCLDRLSAPTNTKLSSYRLPIMMFSRDIGGLPIPFLKSKWKYNIHPIILWMQNEYNIQPFKWNMPSSQSPMMHLFMLDLKNSPINQSKKSVSTEIHSSGDGQNPSQKTARSIILMEKSLQKLFHVF